MIGKLTCATMATVALLCAAQAATDGTKAVTFEADEPGKPPKSFTLARTGSGADGTWIVRGSDGTQVLAQTGDDPTDLRFPLCVYDGFTAGDLTASTTFRPVSGKVDQAAGIVARYRDADHYLLLRANALENNVRFYKVVAGKRYTLAGAEAIVPTGKWQTLSLTVTGRQCTARLEDKVLFDYAGDFETSPGRVGLWTKADSVTEFKDLRIERK